MKPSFAAIARGHITIHYQPEFDVLTRRLIRCDALARWTHSTLDAIPRSKFIPIAEESGLIIPLGIYIMSRRWRKSYVSADDRLLYWRS